MKIQMTNAQFAIWIVQQEPSQMQNEIAEKVYKWLESKEVSPQDTPAIENTLLAKDAQIKELRKSYIDMALIVEQLTTKDLTEEAIKDMRERADRLKESIK
jgi:hypothetical protein